jgi:hypothetical protein
VAGWRPSGGRLVVIPGDDRLADAIAVDVPQEDLVIDAA